MPDRILRAPVTTDEDSEPVDSTSTGRDAFMAMLALHEPFVRAYIMSLHPNWAEAEEILQDTCLRLCQQADEWNPEKDFRGWACTVAKFEVMTYRRRVQRSRVKVSQSFVEAVADSQDERRHDLGLRAEALADCLQKLKPIRRRLLELTYRGGYSVEQVAEQLNYSISATYKTLARLRKSLHECIERAVRVRERE